MERDHILGMICGYYLSQYDGAAYEHLGFRTQHATHDALGGALRVPAESIKNWRDEFDPIHENTRRGWWNREMYPSRRRVIEALGHLTESELLTLVRTLIEDPEGWVADSVVAAVSEAREDPLESGDPVYSLRGVTGVNAEEAFRNHHEIRSEPIPGALIDRRHEQCGFDFEIAGSRGSAYIEVKGLAGQTGGITFTDREWSTAKLYRSAYYLALVRGVATTPHVTLIRDPAASFEPTMRTYTTVQIGWSLSEAVLRTHASRRHS